MANKVTLTEAQRSELIEQFVYHFSWSALGCLKCNAMVDKYEWKLSTIN